MWAIGDPSGPHRERDHVHGASPHRPPEEVGEHLAHLGRVPPVVGRAGVRLQGGTDVGPVLHPGDVAGVGGRPVAVGPLGVRQLGEGPVVHQQLAEAVVLLGGTVQPLDGRRLGECGDLLHPCDQLLVFGGGHGRGLPPRFPAARPPSSRAGHRVFTLWPSMVAVEAPVNGRQKVMIRPNSGPGPVAGPGTSGDEFSVIDRLRRRFAPGRRPGRRRGLDRRRRRRGAVPGRRTDPAGHRPGGGRGPRRPRALLAGRPGLQGGDGGGLRPGRHGGRPDHLLLSLAAPPGTDLDQVAEGVATAATATGCVVVGGDLSGAPTLTVSVAVSGSLHGPTEPGPLLRSGAPERRRRRGHRSARVLGRRAPPPPGRLDRAARRGGAGPWGGRDGRRRGRGGPRPPPPVGPAGRGRGGPPGRGHRRHRHLATGWPPTSPIWPPPRGWGSGSTTCRWPAPPPARRRWGAVRSTSCS